MWYHFSYLSLGSMQVYLPKQTFPRSWIETNCLVALLPCRILSRVTKVDRGGTIKALTLLKLPVSVLICVRGTRQADNNRKQWLEENSIFINSQINVSFSLLEKETMAHCKFTQWTRKEKKRPWLWKQETNGTWSQSQEEPWSLWQVTCTQD